MIKYWGEDEYNLFGFDFEVGDERSWGVVQSFVVIIYIFYLM